MDIYDKIPPQAIQVEAVILGAIMLERDAFDLASEILTAECFYLSRHQAIFRAAKSLSQKNQPVDLLAISQEISKLGEMETVGGVHELTKITNSVTSSANIENHCRIVLEKFMQRQLIIMGGELVRDGYSESADVFDMIDNHEKKFTGLMASNIHSTYSEMDSAMLKGIKHIMELRKKPGHLTGISSGFADIDRITHGWQPTDLIILAARPAVGKTAFALNLARNACKCGTGVGFFSLEMSTAQIANRHISAESGVYMDTLLSGRVDDEQMETINKSYGILSRMKIYTDDSAALNVFQLRSRARMMKRKHNIGMVVIDYLQLMSGTGGNKSTNREQEISKISRDLKGLAKELSIPIIALSQLSRKTEERKGEAKMPQLSDLRESGAIEQDADMVMFLYRPEYYNVVANELGESNKGETHLKIAKHRNGALDTIKLTARLEIQRFEEFKENLFVPDRPGNWRPITEAKKEETPF